MGFKNSGFPHFGFNPLGFRSSGNNKPPFYSKLIQWFKTATDGILVSLIGSSGSEVNRECVNGYYLDGDSIKYMEVYNADGTEFTDADLPTNYEIEFDGFYIAESDFRGFFGTDITGDDKLHVQTRTTDLFMSLYSKSLTIVHGLSTGDKLNLKLGHDGVNGYGVINGDEKFDEAITRVDSNKIMQVLSVGENLRVSNQHCNYFKITNTDTNEELMHFEFEDGNQNNRVEDITRNCYGTIINADGLDRVKTTKLEGVMDKVGYTTSRALGKNLFDKGVANVGYYLDTGGNLSPISTFATSNYQYIKGMTDLIISGITPNSDVAFYDEDFTFIIYVNSNSLTVPSDAVYMRYDMLTGDVDTAQLEQGTTATTYEAYKGYLYPTTLEPVEQGKRSTTVNGKCGWVTTDDTVNFASADTSGGLKANAGVVDGYIYNGEGYANWTVDTASVVNTDSVTINDSGTGGDFAYVPFESVEESTEYLLAFEILDVNGTVDVQVDTINDSAFTGNAILIYSATVGEHRALITSKSTITTKALALKVGAGTVGEYYEFRVKAYPSSLFTDPLTDPLPTSQQPVIGNSQIELTTKYDVVEADKLTTLQHYDHTDEDNVVPIVVAYADMVNSDENVRLIKFDEDGKALEQLLYSEQTEDQTTLNAMMTYIATEGYTLTESSDGWILIDADGNIIYSEV